MVVVNCTPQPFFAMSSTTLDDHEQSEDVLLDGSDTQKPEKTKSDVEVAARFKISPVTLTVFKRKYEDGNFQYWTNLQRAYTKNDGDSFQYTESLRPRDLRKASRLLEKAADKLQGFTVDNDTQSGGGK